MELYQSGLLIVTSPIKRIRSRGLALLAVLLAAASSGWGQPPVEINFMFYGAKPDLTRKQVARLDSLLNVVDRSRIMGVTLVGHSDSLFGRASNAALAEKRAASVKQLLSERGVRSELINVVAFNATVPVVENVLPRGPTKNRRVFMRIEFGPGPMPPR